MSARTLEDRAPKPDTIVHQDVRVGAKTATGPPQGAAIAFSDSERGYRLAAKDESIEYTTRSLSPVVRVDEGSFVRGSLQLVVIAKQHAPRIAFKVKGTILLLYLFDIVAVQAEGNYVSLQHRPHQYLVHETLSSMADKLQPYGFIRIHRSVVVNTSAVEEIRPLSTGEYKLRVRGGKQYLVTRTYKHNLRDLAQLWIGTEQLCG